jgi:hypothetical protein
MRLVRLMLAAAILLLVGPSAWAQPASGVGVKYGGHAGFALPAELVAAPGAESSPGSHVSYSLWTIEGGRIHLRLMVSMAEAQALAGPGKPRLRAAEVADVVSQSLTVSSDAGDCYAIDQGEGAGEIYTMARVPGLHRFEIVYVCDNPKGMVLHDKFLFDKIKTHINYARVQVGSGPPVLGEFTAKSQALAVPVRAPGFTTLTTQGIMRLLHRPEALGLLAALLLLALRGRDLAWIAGGLIGGYAVSIGLAGAGLVLTRPQLSATATAALVIVVAAAGLRRQAVDGERPSRLWQGAAVLAALGMAFAAGIAAFKIGDLSLLVTAGLALFGLAMVAVARTGGRAAWLLLAPALLFGLLDGMGPATDLATLNLPWKAVMPALIQLDLGAGGLAVLLTGAAMALVWTAGRKLGLVRKLGTEIAGAALIGLGVFWFVSRLYS